PDDDRARLEPLLGAAQLVVCVGRDPHDRRRGCRLRDLPPSRAEEPRADRTEAGRLEEWRSPAGAGLPGSRPVSRILSRVAIHLCGYPAPRRAASAEPVRLAPDGVWRARPVARAAGGAFPPPFT